MFCGNYSSCLAVELNHSPLRFNNDRTQKNIKQRIWSKDKNTIQDYSFLEYSAAQCRCFRDAYCLIALMIGAVCTCETSVYLNRLHDALSQKAGHLHTRHRDNLKFHTLLLTGHSEYRLLLRY
jgi:hypothetical protein